MFSCLEISMLAREEQLDKLLASYLINVLLENSWTISSYVHILVASYSCIKFVAS